MHLKKGCPKVHEPLSQELETFRGNLRQLPSRTISMFKADVGARWRLEPFYGVSSIEKIGVINVSLRPRFRRKIS